MISNFARRTWLTVAGIGLALAAVCLALGWWWFAGFFVLLTVALLMFFRDPRRIVPQMRGLIVSPADGLVRSIESLDHFEGFDGPATRIRIFLSVLNVHIQRAPMHGRVISKDTRDGGFGNALHDESAEANAAVTIVMHHPTTDKPLCAVRQIVGAIARRIVCDTTPGEILQRGQRYGIIHFGSTVDLFLHPGLDAKVTVQPGDKVQAGSSIIAQLLDEE
jgi:phosphatidylserine decarboxylase